MAPLASVNDCSTSPMGDQVSPALSDTPSLPVVTAGDQLTVKCVLVGDGAVGKTSLLASYTVRQYLTDYTPTAFDNYTVIVNVDDRPVQLQLRDTAGEPELDSLRTLCYADADIFLLCFNVAKRESFEAITNRWLPEVRRLCPATPVVLVGTQSDRRRTSPQSKHLVVDKSLVVSASKAERLAERIGAAAYVECSASEPARVKDVFDMAIVVTLSHRGLVGGNQPLGMVETGRGVKQMSIGKTNDYWLNGYIIEHKQRSPRHRWKTFLCCCSSAR